MKPLPRGSGFPLSHAGAAAGHLSYAVFVWSAGAVINIGFFGIFTERFTTFAFLIIDP